MTFLRAVDAAEADALSVVAVQDFEGVSVEDRDDGAGAITNIDGRERWSIRVYSRGRHAWVGTSWGRAFMRSG